MATFTGPTPDEFPPGIGPDDPDEDPGEDPDVYAVVVALHPDGTITLVWPEGWARYQILGLLAEGQHMAYEQEEL
jgi:hypothetical protein